MKQAIDEFLRHIEFERRLSAHTVRAYTRNLHDAETFFGDQCGGPVPEPNQVTPKMVRALVAWLSRRDKAAATIRQAVSALQSLFRWLVQQDLLEVSPAEGVRLPRLEQQLPHVIHPGDVQRLLWAPSADTPVGIRDRAVLQVLYSAGLRVAELVALKVEDLNLDAGELLVKLGKGGRSRLAILGPPAVAAVRAWLDVRLRFLERIAAAPSEQPALFITFRCGASLCVRAVERLVKTYASRAGLDPEAISPHTMRHTMACHLLDNGAGLHAVQRLLGHANISATARYTQVSAEQMKASFNQAHPRAQPRGPGQDDKR